MNLKIMNEPYTPEEKAISDLLVEAVNLFVKLPHTHPCHSRDFTDGIHKCQDVLIHKIVQRDYPKEFPTYKK